MKCNRFISAWLCRRIAEPCPEPPYAQRKHPHQKRQFRDASKTRLRERAAAIRRIKDVSCAIPRAPCAIERTSRVAGKHHYLFLIFQQCFLAKVICSIAARSPYREARPRHAGTTYCLLKVAFQTIINTKEQACDEKPFLSQLARNPSTLVSGNPVS